MSQTHIRTFSGLTLHPLEPIAAEVRMLDVAHALAHLCRFTGHVGQFYSVAEHSVRVCQLVPEVHKLAGLLHDAAEAYLGDISTPLKPHVPELVAAEETLLRLILEAHGLAPTLPLAVKQADRILLATEQRDLFHHAGASGGRKSPEGGLVDPLPTRITRPWGPGIAKRNWMEQYRKLGGTFFGRDRRTLSLADLLEAAA